MLKPPISNFGGCKLGCLICRMEMSIKIFHICIIIRTPMIAFCYEVEINFRRMWNKFTPKGSLVSFPPIIVGIKWHSCLCTDFIHFGYQPSPISNILTEPKTMNTIFIIFDLDRNITDFCRTREI